MAKSYKRRRRGPVDFSSLMQEEALTVSARMAAVHGTEPPIPYNCSLEASASSPPSTTPERTRFLRYNLVRRLIIPDVDAQRAIQRSIGALMLAHPELAASRLVAPGQLNLIVLRPQYVRDIMKSRKMSEVDLYDMLTAVREKLGPYADDNPSSKGKMPFVHHHPGGSDPKILLDGSAHELREDRRGIGIAFSAVTGVAKPNTSQTHMEIATFPPDPTPIELRKLIPALLNNELEFPTERRYGPIEIMDMHEQPRHYMTLNDAIKM